MHGISSSVVHIAHRQMFIFSLGLISTPKLSKWEVCGALHAISMYCYTILVGLSCAILLHLVNGNFHPSTQEELSTDISPLLARFSELEATNVETQKQLLQLQKEILILRRENDLKSSELVKINQHLQLMTQSYPGHRFLTEDICHFVNEKCTTKIREGKYAL